MYLPRAVDDSPDAPAATGVFRITHGTETILLVGAANWPSESAVSSTHLVDVLSDEAIYRPMRSDRVGQVSPWPTR
jgi:hypothetical protein